MDPIHFTININTPVMLALIYQHQPDPSWAMKNRRMGELEGPQRADLRSAMQHPPRAQRPPVVDGYHALVVHPRWILGDIPGYFRSYVGLINPC